MDDYAKKYPTDSMERWRQMDVLWGRASTQLVANINIKGQARIATLIFTFDIFYKRSDLPSRVSLGITYPPLSTQLLVDNYAIFHCSNFVFRFDSCVQIEKPIKKNRC